MFPYSSTSMLNAAGFFESPGISIISPQIATTKPAPANKRASVTVKVHPFGTPTSFGLSLIEFGVFAIQTGR